MFSAHARAMAALGRGRDRQRREADWEWPQSVAARAKTALGPKVDGTGMWLVAGLVDVHDEVNAAGCWHTVTCTVVRTPHGGQPGHVVLHFGGRSEPMDYLALVYARDAATVGGEAR
jgi:hypothetical protein